MNYITFSISVILFFSVSLLVGWIILKKSNKEHLALAIIITSGVCALLLLVVFPVNYMGFYENFKHPVCLEYKGKAPIVYIWNQDELGAYINQKPYTFSKHLRNPDKSIQMLKNSLQHDSIPNIDSVQVYQYKYKPLFGFVTDVSKNYLLVIYEDDYVKYGNCKQQLNSMHFK